MLNDNLVHKKDLKDVITKETLPQALGENPEAIARLVFGEFASLKGLLSKWMKENGRK